MKVALLISTYNWPEALNLVLKSALKQSFAPDEIIIADDGSNEFTKKVIEHYKKKTAIDIHHFWQEDNGFRKSAILNKAIANSNSDYIIQVDGDCILHKHLIKDHLSSSEYGHFLFGSRVNIQENFLSTLFDSEKVEFKFYSKGIKKRTRTLRIPFLSNFFRPSNQLSKKLRGCNISFFKNDLIAINGYNEDFEGWGKEDSELAVRLLNIGIKGKRIRYKGIVYHIWHKEESKNNLAKNEEIERFISHNKSTFCIKGINKYL